MLIKYMCVNFMIYIYKLMMSKFNTSFNLQPNNFRVNTLMFSDNLKQTFMNKNLYIYILFFIIILIIYIYYAKHPPNKLCEYKKSLAYYNLKLYELGIL